jgi:uncharacterized protein YjbI with pentapeptide repeats
MLIENMTLTLDLPQLAAILTLVLLGLVVAARLANGPFLDGLNVARTPTLRWLLVALLFVGPFLALIFAAVSLELALAVIQRDHEAVRNLGLLLTGVIGAGLVAWRNWTASRQADLQDEALFNDKINAAAEDLAARRQVTRRITVTKGRETEKKVLTEWQDDVVTRSAAIDRLESLARERAQVDPTIVPRIASLLSVYVRELSKGDLKPKEHGLSEEEATPEALSLWARSLRPIRSDLEKAAQVLGRLRRIAGQQELVIDLREANLQGFNLQELDFDLALMKEAKVQGASLSQTLLRRAALQGTKMQGTKLTNARMQGAYLSRAQLQGAVLSGAQMQGAEIFGTRLQGAMLHAAQLQGALLYKADLHGAKLHGTRISQSTILLEGTLVGAGVRSVDWSSADSPLLEVAEMFGDGSVVLPFDNPNWWPSVSLVRDAWYIEFTHWLSNPTAYDWSQRREHYTADGEFNPDNLPPELRG